MSPITGEKIRLTYGERTVDAEVVLASPCGRSLFLQFEAMLGDAEGMYVGQMPVLQGDDGVYRDLLRGQTVLIDRKVGFCCPRCQRVSHHPSDMAQGYCGACHDWTRQ